jgi:hypothetical protein
MSFGYSRRQSPAARAAAISKAAGEGYKAHRLSRLHITSVDSVDKGAGGSVVTGTRCAVVLTKRWDGVGELGYRRFAYTSEPETSTEKVMSDIGATVVGVLKKVESQNYDPVSLARLEQALAIKAYPLEKSIGVALSKWHGSVEGQMFSAELRNLEYTALQKRCSVGDGYGAALKLAKSDDRQDGGVDDDDVDQAIERLAAKYREANPHLTKEQAFAHVVQHDTLGRRLFEQSKARDLRKNG